jgi:cytochrome c peroxidase
MTIAVGDRLPEAIFLEKGIEGIAAVTGESLFAGRRVVLFGVPGAYTGVCSTRHVPSFIRVADALRAKGIEEIACVAVNDPFVMGAWGDATGATNAGIRMLSDAAAAFTRAMGLIFDNPDRGLISRSKRYALLAEDGVIRVLNVEASTGECGLSAGETMLAAA